MDGDLLVNRDGVRIVQSEVEAVRLRRSFYSFIFILFKIFVILEKYIQRKERIF